ncbi:MAG TPA: DMT family transporter, partial [Longimicrobiaceae bacterium]|nr:DMT family transporter [Longimicrobiaceae bacterium]
LAPFFFSAGAPRATASNPETGNLLALLSGVCWAFTVVGLRWAGSRRGEEGSALPTVVAGNLLAFLACLPQALPAHAEAADWVVITYLGAVQIGAAYVLLAGGLRHVPALEASVLLLLEPAVSPLWAWLAHGEAPGAWALAGGVLILGATVARTWWDARAAPDVAAGLESPK